jgi:N4-gp56 family major capsid protein
MADVFTSTATLSNQVVAAYDRRAFMALREGAIFDQYARVKPGNVTSPGSSVSFLFWDDLSPATTALAETVDVDAVGLSDSIVTVTPTEHGNSVLVTIKVRKQSFSLGFDSEVADIVAYNMLDSLETLAEIALTAGGSTETVDGGAESSLTATDVLTMAFVRQQIAKLRGAKVRPSSGSNYDVILHPDVSYDIMADTAGGAWQDLKHTDASKLRIGQVGQFAGANFVENARARINPDGGSGTADTYTTYVLGAEAFGKAEDIPLHIVPGPVTDRLMRFMPLGWYGLFGHKVIRSAALRRIISASSIGDNS